MNETSKKKKEFIILRVLPSCMQKKLNIDPEL